jgi:NADH-quinone oxidoreductase subunit L
VQNDIKRVVAYSTLSQLGYMTVALGASAYSVATFHLMTHAFFKALLFLAAGSVIIGMHHEQDIRKMGGLWKKMPVTWVTSLVGTLALVGTPFFSGFYSKDSIILATDAAARAGEPGAPLAYWAVLSGVFITALYSFRMFFLVFHGKPRWPQAGHGHSHHGEAHHGEPHESPNVVTVPLVFLAIPSIVIGFATIDRLLFGGFFSKSIVVNVGRHPAMKELAEHFHGSTAMAMHGLLGAPFWLMLAGVVLAAYLYLARPDIPEKLAQRFGALYRLLENKYYLDRFNEVVFAGGARLLGRGLWKGGDVALIDGLVVNGSARVVGWLAALSRLLQSGYIYHYAFGMIIGLLIMVTLFVTVS